MIPLGRGHQVDEVVMRTLGSIPFVLLLVSCGGKVDGEPSGARSGAVPRSSVPPEVVEDEEMAVPSGTEEGEWGTWQLLSVDGPDGRRQYDPPYVELDLHPTGAAYLWTCSTALTGKGERCPYYARMNCFTGTISSDGRTWRVDFPAKAGASTTASGEISDEPSGDITVKGRGALHADGHYRRVAAASPDGCVP